MINIQSIESNIGIGIITPQKYLSNIKEYLKDQEIVLKQLSVKVDSKNMHYMRVKKRVELITAEIKDMEEPQEEEPEPVQQ